MTSSNPMTAWQVLGPLMDLVTPSASPVTRAAARPSDAT